MIAVVGDPAGRRTRPSVTRESSARRRASRRCGCSGGRRRPGAARRRRERLVAAAAGGSAVGLERLVVDVEISARLWRFGKGQRRRGGGVCFGAVVHGGAGELGLGNRVAARTILRCARPGELLARGGEVQARRRPQRHWAAIWGAMRASRPGSREVRVTTPMRPLASNKVRLTLASSAGCTSQRRT